MKEQSEMTTKIILVVVAITTGAVLSSMAGAVPTQYVHAAKEKCTTYEHEDGFTSSQCVTQGKDPTLTFESCDPVFGCSGGEFELTHRDAAEAKTDDQQNCKQIVNDNDDDGVTCSSK